MKYIAAITIMMAGLCGLVSAAEVGDGGMTASEVQLMAADKLWLKGSPKKAVPLYEALLENLPKEYEPFRSLVIMRLARANFQAGNNAQCLSALEQLNKLPYVPEHHALAAEELKAVISGKPNPAYRKTEVPDIEKPLAVIHVMAASGKGGDGSMNRPVGTLSEAVELARRGRAKNGSGTIEILLAPGTYQQKQPLQLSAKDKGLVIRSGDPKNPAVISSGVVLTSWKPVSDEFAMQQLPQAVQNKVLVCDLKSHGIESVDKLVFGGFSSKRAKGGNHRFKTMPVPELFYKGKPQTMARWPNGRLTRLPIAQKPEKPDPRYAKWAKEKDLWLYGYWFHDWADAYEKVAAIDESGKITLEPPTNSYGFGLNRGCVINAMCELDEVGEWYLDTEKGLLYYLPPDGFDAGQCVLSYFGTPIEAADCPSLQIRDIRVEYVRGDAMVFRNSSELVVAGVDIKNCSGMGLKVEGGKRHLIHSCTIDGMGRGGIDIQAGDWRKLDPSFSVIENCRISNLSRIDRTYTPAIVLEGMGLKVRRNSFVNIPSSAIRLEGCDDLIELNYFNRCVYESGDQGAIDMWANPLYRGNVIRWNDFDRIISETAAKLGAAGVRHDDFISGFMVAENVFRKGSRNGFGSVQYNKGTDNYFEGNIIVDWQKAFSGRSAQGEEWRKVITEHSNSKQMLEQTDWKSDAWQKKYPMLRDLMNGDDNHNYLADNQRFGSGQWGAVGGAVTFANVEGNKYFHANTLESVKAVLVPWHPIPLELIGPYKQ
jgi:hypothetical protein